MAAQLLLIEDDRQVSRALTLALEVDGHSVREAPTGTTGLSLTRKLLPDLVLLDLMLPDMDGLDVCRQIRRGSDVPVIMVTARADSRHVVEGLEAGADDYVAKPVVARELSLRVGALLRRSHRDQLPDRMQIGDLELVPAEAAVRRGGEDLHLTKTEFRLLCELASRPGEVHTREQLLERVWDYDYFGDTRLLDVHIHRLRSKLEADPSHPRHITTARGLGYQLQL